MASFHCGCSSAKAFSLRWPASRQRPSNWCRMRLKPFQSPSLAVGFRAAQALTSSISARRCALCSAASALTLSSQASTTLWASLQASSKRFHRRGWAPRPGRSASIARARREAAPASCARHSAASAVAAPGLRPEPDARTRLRPWPPAPGAAGRHASAASLPVSPAAASAACAWFSSLSSISLPCSLSALRSAVAAPALALPWPSAISCSSLASASRTAWVACARTSGSTLGLAGLTGASTGTPRAARSSSAHTGTGGSGADASSAAATAWARALWNASHTACSWAREASSRGGNFVSTLGPVRIRQQCLGLRLPVRNVLGQRLRRRPGRHARTWSTALRCAAPAAPRPRAAPGPGAASPRCP